MSKTTTLVLVRHGETDWNHERRSQGHTDVPLNDTGLRQSAAAAHALAGQHFDALYSSDLARAMQTAQAIAAATGLSIVPDARLRERPLGVMQGLTTEEFAARHPPEHRLFYTGAADWVIPEGESQQQAYDRVVQACHEYALRHIGGRVLVVTHGGCIGYLLKAALGLPAHAPRRWSIYNGGLHTFAWLGSEWRMLRWGDIDHLSSAMDGVSL